MVWFVIFFQVAVREQLVKIYVSKEPLVGADVCLDMDSLVNLFWNVPKLPPPPPQRPLQKSIIFEIDLKPNF